MGTELLVGDTVDTNSAWLARRLDQVGGEVAWHLTTGDDHDDIVAALSWLVGRCDAVVCGGGLGPTPDDRTRQAVAAVAGVPLVARDDLARRIEDMFARVRRPMASANLRQAEVPEGARALDPVGTAPGFVVEVDRAEGGVCAVYALPGVPHEYRTMVDRDVLADLLRRGERSARVTRVLHVAGMGESDVAAALEEVTGGFAEDVEVGYLAEPDEIQVKIVARSPDFDDARRRAQEAVDAVVAVLGPAVSGIDDQRLADTLARLLRDAALTVATAESCTAGLVAARLSTVAGASDYLRGGIVAYATEAKSGLLGVPRDVLDEAGPVHEATAGAMARRARELFDADIGLAVTCVAGPTTQGGREVGTVALAMALPDGSVRTRELTLPGDRATVQSRAATAVLEALRRQLARSAS